MTFLPDTDSAFTGLRSALLTRYLKKFEEDARTMEIKKVVNGSQLTVYLDGRLDTITSQQLERELRTSIDGITELVFDLEKLSYITSAGLRVLSVSQKVMNRQGKMIVRNMQPDVREVFDVTGLSNIMEIQ